MLGVWGNFDTMQVFASEAVDDLKTAASAPTNWGGVAGLILLKDRLLLEVAGLDRTEQYATSRQLTEEIAQRLVMLAGDGETAGGVLVSGFDLLWEQSNWRAVASFGTEGHSSFGEDSLRIGGAAALQLFMRVGDYTSAVRIANEHPGAFLDCGSRGWAAAARGFVDPARSAQLFNDAADEFSRDTFEEAQREHRDLPWSSINVDLWSKYFRARGEIAAIVDRPDETIECISRAKAFLMGTNEGWVAPQVNSLRAFVSALYLVLGSESDYDESQALEVASEFVIGEMADDDHLILAFVDAARQAFAKIRANPALAVTRLPLAEVLDILGRIPFLAPVDTAALEPAIGPIPIT
jgi:hypothetical protein